MVAPLIKLGITVALTAAQMALGALRKIEGPRLDDLSVTLAEYGTPIPDFWGTRRFEGCPIFWAEKLREKKKKSKTKGGKYNEYKYFGTWGVVIAGHEIDAVRRIWLDKHLVYQRADAGPVAPILGLFKGPLGLDIKLQTGKNLRIYLGTEDQLPDPRMEAWYEDQPDFGPDTCPAHRGMAYLIFQDIPLEKFGNRIPQVSIEALSSKTPAFPYEIKATHYSVLNAQFSPDHSTIYSTSGGNFEVWDVPTRTKLAEIGTTGGSYAAAEGGFYALNSFFGQSLIFVTQSGGEVVYTENADIPVIMGGVYYVGGQVFTTPSLGTGAYANASTSIGADFVVSNMFADLEGNAIAVGLDGTDIRIFNANTGQDFSVTAAGVGAPYGMTNSEGKYVLIQASGESLLIDPDTETLLDDSTVSFFGDIISMMRAQPVGAATFWLSFNQYNAIDLSYIRSMVDPIGLGAIQGTLYDPISDAIIAGPLFANEWAWIYIDRADGAGVPLGDIIEEDALRCGMTIDGSALNQTVPGWSVTQGSGKDRIAPLLDLHDSIICPHDFSFVGKKRGTTSLGTIHVSDFVREGDDPRYTVETAQDTDLPQRMEVKFADNDFDQQTNNVISFRHTDAVDTVRVQAIDLTTYADSANEMQQKADRFLRRQWNSRSGITNTLTAQLMAAEPGDIYDLDLDGVLWTAELQKITFSAGDNSGALSCEWRRTFPSLNSISSGTAPGMGGRDPEVIFVPGPSQAFVFDIPLVSDADNSTNPVLYYGAGSYGVGIVSGVSILEGDPDGIDYGPWNDVDSSGLAVWGSTEDALGDANPCLWDRGNTVSVRIFGTLSNATETEINADPSINMFVLRNPATGDIELANFCNATLTGTNGAANVYTLDTFLRGRRGTEWATGSHAAGDEFILVEDLTATGMGLSDIGSIEHFKAQTYGRDEDSSVVIDVDFEGASMKPYAPVIWHVEKDDGTGDISIEIRTRTRIGGAWNGSTIPTGETIAEYEFDVYDGASFKRTLESTEKTFVYTAADQTADFGMEINADELEGFAYQLSATVGRGFARAA